MSIICVKKTNSNAYSELQRQCLCKFDSSLGVYLRILTFATLLPGSKIHFSNGQNCISVIFFL